MFWKPQDKLTALERRPKHHQNNLIWLYPKQPLSFLLLVKVCPSKTLRPNFHCPQPEQFEHRNQVAINSLLNCPKCQTSYEMLLHKKEHKNWWYCGNNATSAHHVISGTILTVKSCNTSCDGLGIRPLR